MPRPRRGVHIQSNQLNPRLIELARQLNVSVETARKAKEAFYKSLTIDQKEMLNAIRLGN